MFKLYKGKKVINTTTPNNRDSHANEGTAHRYNAEFNIYAKVLVHVVTRRVFILRALKDNLQV